jgi:hypothetical protein
MLLAPAPLIAKPVVTKHVISGLRLIDLRMGENQIAHFAADGRPARIIEAWRGNGNAHSYHLYMVLMGGGEQDNDWNIVGVDTGPSTPFLDTIADEPHTGEDFVFSVYFAHARLDGKPQTLLLTARRHWKESYGDAGITTFDVYKLANVSEEGGPGTTDQFQLVEAFDSTTRACNSDLAFSQQFGVPLPKGYVIANTKDGCP